MESVAQVQILGQAEHILLFANALGKGISPSFLPLSSFRQIGQIGFLALFSWIQTNFTLLKIWPCGGDFEQI